MEDNPLAGAMSRPLAGIRVLDIGHYVAGPWCSRLLASLGAEVIKLEPPSGDPLRSQQPTIARWDGVATNPTFIYVNGGKLGVTLNLKAPKGKALFLRLVASADIVVENFSPRALPALDLSYDVIRRANPRCSLISISNFGQHGPDRDRPATELILYAASGLMSISGVQGREPLKHGLFTQAQLAAGTMGAFAATTAIASRRGAGAGDWADVSIAEVLSSELVAGISYYTYSGAVQGRQRAARVNIDGRVGLIQAADGAVHPSLGTADGKEAWENLANMLQEPSLIREEFFTHSDRLVRAEELAALMEKAVARKKKQELFHEANAWRLPWGVSQELSELLNCPQLNSRNFFSETKDGPIAGLPYKSSLEVAEAPPLAPSPGQDSERVYQRLLGITKTELTTLRSEGII